MEQRSEVSSSWGCTWAAAASAWSRITYYSVDDQSLQQLAAEFVALKFGVEAKQRFLELKKTIRQMTCNNGLALMEPHPLIPIEKLDPRGSIRANKAPEMEENPQAGDIFSLLPIRALVLHVRCSAYKKNFNGGNEMAKKNLTQSHNQLHSQAIGCWHENSRRSDARRLLAWHYLKTRAYFSGAALTWYRGPSDIDGALLEGGRRGHYCSIVVVAGVKPFQLSAAGGHSGQLLRCCVSRFSMAAAICLRSSTPFCRLFSFCWWLFSSISFGRSFF